MTETGERPTEDSPFFVKQRAERAFALVAGLCVGTTVLDLACGEDSGLWKYVQPWCSRYDGIDIAAHTGVGDDSRFNYHQGDLFELSIPSADTVVALEIFEHVYPGQQRSLIELAWSLTNRRLIITGTAPDVLTWYPRTEWFVGVQQPYHLREIHEQSFRDYLYDLCPGRKEMFTLRSYLAADDEMIWGVDRGPVVVYLFVIEKQ